MGGRIALCPPCRRDRGEFLASVERSAALHHPWTSPPRTPQAFTEYLRRSRGGDYFGFLARLGSEGDLVGVINVSSVVMGALRSGYAGYYGFSDFGGQGLMTEALGLVVRHCFSELGLHRLEANIQPDNAPSLALARRCGFRLEGFSPHYLNISGEWRDHERWAIAVEDLRDGSGPTTAERRAVPTSE
ncbi:MAG: GNAT family N-acetyltransferase [Acidimicrobiia bacterium]